MFNCLFLTVSGIFLIFDAGEGKDIWIKIYTITLYLYLNWKGGDPVCLPREKLFNCMLILQIA